jgi:glycosyltransferase involved in cell wall biosynthesis
VKHVLFLVPTLRGGGAERVIATLLTRLDRAAFRCSLAVVDMRGAVYLGELPDDVSVLDLDCTRVRYALPRIARLIWKVRPDVVLSTLGHLNLALAMIRPLLPNGTCFFARETVVVTENLSTLGWPRLWRRAYRFFYPRFDSVVCQSRDMRDDLIERLAFPADKAVLVHNPVDIERIRRQAREAHREAPAAGNRSASESSVSLVAAGRLVRQKGFDLLIEALALCRSIPWTLTILGEGPLRSDLERLAHDVGVAERVRFAGFHGNPYPFFAAADAFVLSSRYEGFPNVVLEALACGTPVIATPAPGGVREILDAVPESIVSESISAASLADAITSWCARPRARVSTGRVEPYAVRRIVSQYEALLDGSVRS